MREDVIEDYAALWRLPTDQVREFARHLGQRSALIALRFEASGELEVLDEALVSSVATAISEKLLRYWEEAPRREPTAVELGWGSGGQTRDEKRETRQARG